jgi:hypothetical protein
MAQAESVKAIGKIVVFVSELDPLLRADQQHLSPEGVGRSATISTHSAAPLRYGS